MSAILVFLFSSICSPLSFERERYVAYHPESVANCRQALIAIAEVSNVNKVLLLKEKKILDKAQRWAYESLPPLIASSLIAAHQIYVTREINFNVYQKARFFVRIDGSFGVLINF